MGKEPLESEPKAKGLITRLGRWTGFGEKKLWDFLELLIVPAVLAIGAFYLEEQASNRQEQIATARYQQEALAKYFDQMTQLLLEKKLRQPGSEAQVIARARTLSTLGELDDTRKRLLLKFLYEAQLISPNKQNKTVVSLIDANLKNAHLDGTKLFGADLFGADLRGARLIGADLGDARLENAHLDGADLRDAHLDGADLRDARLIGTNLRGADLENAHLENADLRGAYLTGTDLRGAFLENAHLDGAVLRGARLSEAKNLEPGQIKAARDWEQAIYSPDFRRQLGLPTQTPVTLESSKSTP